MHEVGWQRAQGMDNPCDPAARLQDDHPDGHPHDDACNDFRSQTPLPATPRAVELPRELPELRRSDLESSPDGPPASSHASSAYDTLPVCDFGRASVAPPHRSAAFRIPVRDARGDADDSALASGMVRQPLLLPVSHAPRDLVASGFARGVSTGLGVLNVWIGFWEAFSIGKNEETVVGRLVVVVSKPIRHTSSLSQIRMTLQLTTKRPATND